MWEADMSFRQAFVRSCAPCYQGIARKIGSQLMRRYIDTLAYPGMQFDSSSVDYFWLGGPSRITPFQQAAFLQRFYLLVWQLLSGILRDRLQ